MTMTQASAPERNSLGLTLQDYKGKTSTLCPGCGHDAITTQIIRAFFEYGVDPSRVIKISGIGCSSKTPAYFMDKSFGFNSVHGRMPSIATGALLANRQLKAIGISGDGDTASIGIGQFVHAMRRNIPMVYIMENNGVYGLTKGQFSATADDGSQLKKGIQNELPPVDCCALAIELGCGFVARSFAGDPKQLLALIKGAIGHKGMAFLDVLSPCITFNNHEGSTKSYRYLKEAEEMLHEIGFVPSHQPISADYLEGSVKVVELHDGSHLVLRKLEKEYDPNDKINALKKIHETKTNGEVLTGLFYINTRQPDFLELLQMQEEPLASLSPEKARPSREALKQIMERLR
jgi:2-oxoglutarate/2-oxoacid ferredoxin oxidoreductase subunit beta